MDHFEKEIRWPALFEVIWPAHMGSHVVKKRATVFWIAVLWMEANDA